MKELTFIFAVVLNLNLFAAELIEQKSLEFINNTESCDEVMSNHVSIVKASEEYILSLISKKSIELGAYEINRLQNILTNRFLHLAKAVTMYQDPHGTEACAPQFLGNAIAVYDLTTLGKMALNDAKLRRIISNFTKFPRYQLTNLKEIYSHYSSEAFIQELSQQINESDVVLPTDLIINKDTHNLGHFDHLRDKRLEVTSSMIAKITKIWGNISDRLKWRKGRMSGNTQALNLIRASLRPLDLLYEKRTFTLTNYTIPGHWGHIAIWLGTKEELIERGIWDKEFFEPFRGPIEEGKNIIEIRKKGINFISLQDFINLDEIAITRLANNLTEASSIYQELSEQLEKPYDFTFNVQTSDKLTCSELVAYSFGDIHWPGVKTLGQVMIRPDDIAILSLYQNSPAEFVLYLKGKTDHSVEQKSFDDWKNLFSKRTKKVLVYQ